MIFCTGDQQDELQAIGFYRENGFAIFDHAVSGPWCAAVLDIYERHADDDYATILNLDREVPAIRELVMKNPTAVRLAELLIDNELVGCQTFFLFKKPGTRYAKQEFAPHQDNSYPRSVDGAYLAVDIALADQDKGSGGVCLWPQTHRLGLLPFEEKTGYREKEGEKAGNPVIMPSGQALDNGNGKWPDFATVTWATEADLMVWPKLDIALKKGQMMIFDGNLIHASYPNLSDKWRPAVITNYLKKDADMIPGRTANRLRIPLK